MVRRSNVWKHSTTFWSELFSLSMWILRCSTIALLMVLIVSRNTSSFVDVFFLSFCVVCLTLVDSLESSSIECSYNFDDLPFVLNLTLFCDVCQSCFVDVLVPGFSVTVRIVSFPPW